MRYKKIRFTYEYMISEPKHLNNAVQTVGVPNPNIKINAKAF